MEKKSNSELKREFSERKREFEERQEIGRAQLQKAKELKPEFDKLDYPGKIKFMEEHFDGIPGIHDKEERLLSIFPDEHDPEQIRLFNEYFIKRWERNEGEMFIEYSFERLTARFFAHIDKIHKTNQVPDDLIREYIEKEIKTYSERVKTPFIQSERDFYNGNWDLSKRVIETSYLMAQAYYNYLPFLKEQLNKGIARGRGEKTFPEYLINIPEEKKVWFADQLKKEFNTEKGLQIRYMIDGLKKMNYLSFAHGQGRALVRSMKKYFDQNIGSPQSILDQKEIFESDVESAIVRIKAILNQ
jgi:hypothetical protein